MVKLSFLFPFKTLFLLSRHAHNIHEHVNAICGKFFFFMIIAKNFLHTHTQKKKKVHSKNSFFQNFSIFLIAI